MVFAIGQKPWNKGTAQMDECICKMCDKHFSMLRSQVIRDGRGKFCSKKCFYDAKKKFSRRVQVEALYEQGKTYREMAAILGIPQNTVSSMVYYLKLNNRYGDAVTSKRAMPTIKNILKEDYGVDSCELCGYSRVIEMAHIVERKNGGEYLINNCLLLCPNCHHLFDYNMLAGTEKHKLLSIDRLNGNLKGRLEKCLTVVTN